MQPGLYSNRNGARTAEVETMSETFWESDGAVETASESASQSANEGQPQHSHEEPAALAVSADDFAALEERIRRAVDLVKRERQARAGAEARSAELEARVTQAEAQVQAQSPIDGTTAKRVECVARGARTGAAARGTTAQATRHAGTVRQRWPKNRAAIRANT